MASYLSSNFLSAEVEKALIVDWQNHRQNKSAEAIIEAFQPLLNGVLKRYKYYGIAYEDLQQEALVGLCTALERYDISKGVRFSNYAKLWINAHCQDYVMRNWSIVRVGTTNLHKKLFFQLRYIKRKLESIHTHIEQQPTMHSIAKELQTSIQEVVAMYERLTFKDRYLDEKISDNSNTTYADMLPAPAISQERTLIEKEYHMRCKSILKNALQSLSQRELDILYKHRLAEVALTLDDIGTMYGITRERVRQIELNSLRKLKKALAANKVRNIKNI
jgi:RNA polymerase sigma-32 factor